MHFSPFLYKAEKSKLVEHSVDRRENDLHATNIKDTGNMQPEFQLSTHPNTVAISI